MTKLHLKSLLWGCNFVCQQLKTGLMIRLGLYSWYVKKQLLKRRGSCVSCGHCCFDFNTMERCIYYDSLKSVDRCKINNSKPLHCKVAPLSDGEVKMMSCQGYNFRR